MRVPGARAVKPTLSLIVVIAVLFSVFALAGGVYDLLERPIALLPRPQGQGWTFIYPGSVNVQTLNESLLSGLLYLLAVAGLYAILQSTRRAYRPRNAYLLLLVGFVLVTATMGYLDFILQSKVAR